MALKKIKITLRKSQKRCIAAMQKIRSPGVYNFQLYCGSGKSRIISSFIKKHKDKKHLILVPSIQILSQFVSHFNDDGPNPALYYTEANKKTEDEKEDDPKNYVSIAVYNSYEQIQNKKFDYVYIDEAHHIYRPEIIRLLQKEKNKKGFDPNYIQLIQTKLNTKFQFNFSATLGRVELSYDLSLQEALKEKIITDYKLNIVIFGTKVQDLYKLKGNRLIVYCKNLLECAEISKKLKCEYLSGEMSLQERYEILQRFKDGIRHSTGIRRVAGSTFPVKFLCSCRTISEGVDVPFVDGAVFWGNKNSEIDIIQCIGRTQRLYTKKKQSQIYIILKPKKNIDGYTMVQSNLSKFCGIITEYDSEIKKKIAVGSIYKEDAISSSELKILEEKVFKYCRLCCYKYRFEDIYILEMCEKYYKLFKKLPKSEDIILDENNQPFKIGRFINCVRHGRFQRIEQQVKKIFNVLDL